MSNPRVKGQETVLSVVENGVAVDFGQPKDFETTEKLDILTEGYLGETTDQKDSIYKGFAGKITVHFSNRALLDFRQRVVNKARRRTAGTVVNIRTTLNFPGGPKVRVICQGCEFGDIPMGFGGRAEYGTVTLTFEGSSTLLI